MDLNNLPLRTQMRELHTALYEADDDTLRKYTDISFYTIFMNLRYTPVNRGFVYDIFHLILQNIAKDMFILWIGDEPFDINDNSAHNPNQQISREYIIHQHIWVTMGTEMARAGCLIPSTY